MRAHRIQIMSLPKLAADIQEEILGIQALPQNSWVRTAAGGSRKSEIVGIELYDHRTDPSENTNVGGEASNRSVVSQLAKRLRDGWAVANETRP